MVLTNRLEVLLGLTGTEEQYHNLCKQYQEIIVLAGKYYDMVFVDLDRRMSRVLQKEILKRSDVIVPIVTQKPNIIKENKEYFSKAPDVNIQKAIFTLGKYDDKSKYNAKNLSRNMLKTKDIINTIPNNTLLFDAAQEGDIVDLLLNISRLKGKDENTAFLAEITRLGNDIKLKLSQMQQMRN